MAAVYSKILSVENHQKSSSGDLNGDEKIFATQRPDGSIDVYCDPARSFVDGVLVFDAKNFVSGKSGSRPLAAIIPGSDEDIRYEIGEAEFVGNQILLKLFGELDVPSRNFLF